MRPPARSAWRRMPMSIKSKPKQQQEQKSKLEGPKKPPGKVPRLATLLDQIVATFRRFVAFTDSLTEPVLLTLWTVHTWVLDAFDATPFLILQSPAPESGKTTVLRVLNELVRAPWFVVQPTDAAFFRD